MDNYNKDKFETSFSLLFKYILIGDTSVGKSCILLQFIDKRFRAKHDVTIGVEFGARIIKIDGKQVKLSIWDTAGQESFRSITRSYYRSAAAAIIVYDVTKRESFNNVMSWLEEAKQNSNKEITFLLVGNKIDLEEQRKVSTEEGQNLADMHDIFFLEASAKSNIKIDEIFYQTANKINDKIRKGLIDPRNENFGIRIGAEYKHPTMTSITNNEEEINTDKKTQKSSQNCCQ